MLALTGITACGKQSGATAGRNQSSASAAAPPSATANSSIGLPAPTLPGSLSPPDRTDEENAQQAWLRAMWEYDRFLVSDGPTALERADQLCLDLRKETSEARAERDAAKLFEVDSVKAKKIVTITKSTRCPI
ncbi:hypothetical protein ODJ79_09820 [Actinoplanes sp. KI2]|uniref:hypothetical protein n=1 Tax=Actinoplanes sp. KI2 TaxID=2983315 RepID=UPI0021D5FDAE|nr:hypothetical protein [Actinoplanes sp. KI2]MCU7724012.1 hypothetical protein [Actinoplanes sp. KI2]